MGMTDNREDHVDRKQARAFEGFVAESGDALLRTVTGRDTVPPNPYRR
jgi:hypothetical protein